MAVTVAKQKTDEATGAIQQHQQSNIGAALAQLHATSKKIKENLFTDLRVPRWTDFQPGLEIWVRYKPITQTLLDERSRFWAAKSDDLKDWVIYANADVLVNHCVGIYATLDGDHDQKYSLKLGPDGEPVAAWTKFDADLAAAIDVPIELTSVQIAKALYKTDGDLTNASGQLVEWSNEASEKATEDF